MLKFLAFMVRFGVAVLVVNWLVPDVLFCCRIIASGMMALAISISRG